VDRSEEEEVTARFVAACETGDIASLAELLDPEVVFRADGGGVVAAPRRPVSGRDTVIKIVGSGFRRTPGLTVAAATVNGGPGMRIYSDGELIGVGALTIHDGTVRAIDVIGNPAKLPQV
jgi:RNA polymerase sigma-70 factor (ECF subfamily)